MAQKLGDRVKPGADQIPGGGLQAAEGSKLGAGAAEREARVERREARSVAVVARLESGEAALLRIL